MKKGGSIEIATIGDVADAMRRDFRPAERSRSLGRTILLVGAGCSRSAGIPLASEIAQDLVGRLAMSYSALPTWNDDPLVALRALVNKGKFPPQVLFDVTTHGQKANWPLVYDLIFSQHYRTPKEVRTIFSEIFDRSDRRINWAHICIGELVRLGYVSTVLTTNFDQLALEGIARTGRLPVVADGLESLSRITGDSNYPQLVQIHGSRHTYYLRNSVEDTDELANDIGARHAVDELFRTAKVFMAIGYGGRERGLMQLLIEAGKRFPDTRIFWVLHSQNIEDSSDYVRQFMMTSRHSALIPGQDADEFFRLLLEKLQASPPKIIEDPLYLVKDLKENLVFSDNENIRELIETHQNKVLEIQAAASVNAEIETGGTSATTLTSGFLQAQRMQAVGQLAGGVAHDFTNILQAIIGFSDLMLANYSPTDSAFHDLMQIKQNANRGTMLVRQLLAFARRQHMELKELDIGTVLQDLTMLLRRLVGGHVHLEVKHDDLWAVRADLNQIEQVIVNLVVNARDAMPHGGTINITAENVGNATGLPSVEGTSIPAGDYVCVSIADTGIGISPEYLEKIFEPFFTTKEGGKGSGLGLSTVFGIVKQLGGFINVASPPGHGTTFSLYFPRFVRVPETGQKIDTKSEGLVADLTHHRSILLVEPDDSVRAAATRSLSARGYDVMKASSAGDALRLIRKREGAIDLIVSDVAVPLMDGSTLFEVIHRHYPNMKVLFISDAVEGTLARHFPLDAKYKLLLKPFTLKKFGEAVKESIEG
jgi:signal transduction histidine kinase